jgi:RimJ/RimL family protein N-acetyltransferase
MDRETEAAVGYLILQGVQDPDQALLIKRIVIVEKGKGYGRATLEWLLNKAFHDLGAHRVWLTVMEDNDRARSLYRSLGFIEEGKLRECVKSLTGFRSVWLMSLLRSEFLSRDRPQ